MKGVAVKVDGNSKNNENAKVPSESKSAEQAPQPSHNDGYAFIRKDKEGRMFLLTEVSSELEKMHETRQKIEFELGTLIMQEKLHEKDKEIMALKLQILERELLDVKTAKSFKMEAKRRENLLHAEYMEKIRKEVGHKTFGLSEDDEILLNVN